MYHLRVSKAIGLWIVTTSVSSVTLVKQKLDEVLRLRRRIMECLILSGLQYDLSSVRIEFLDTVREGGTIP